MDQHEVELRKRIGAAAERHADRQRSLMLIWLTFATIAVTLLGVGYFYTTRVQAQQRDGILCLLHELSDHRQNNYAADKAQAQFEKRDLTVPAPAPRQIVPDARRACAPYVD